MAVAMPIGAVRIEVGIVPDGSCDNQILVHDSASGEIDGIRGDRGEIDGMGGCDINAESIEADAVCGRKGQHNVSASAQVG